MKLAFKCAGAALGAAGLFYGLLCALNDLYEYRESRKR